MYPVLRLVLQSARFRNRPLDLLGLHVSEHLCLPWDLDPWMELNNGRTLTLYDLGRVPFSGRIGIHKALMAQGWGMTVAGSSVRYRRRIRMFQKFQMRTRLLGWDARFLYIEQSMWRQGEALNHLLIRAATTGPQGIVPPAKLIAAMGHGDLPSPALPEWAAAWIEADGLRPWPPRMENL